MAEAPARAGIRQRALATDTWLSPLAVALGLLALLALAYWVSYAGFVGMDQLLDADGPLGLARRTRFNLILALLVSYTVGAGVVELRSARRDFDALRPVLAASPEESGRVRRELERAPLARLMTGISCGIAVAVPLWLAGHCARAGSLAGDWPADEVWSFLLGTTLFMTMGAVASLSHRASQLLSELGRTRARVRLLDLEPLVPFAQRGIRTASYWFVGSAIASLLFLDARPRALIAPPLLVTFALGVVALLHPCRGIHARIRATKRDELARVRGEIERERDSWFEPAGDANPGPSPAPALLAYEARIESVREWPFDTPTLRRFALLLLIPLGSWLGGALVERFVDAFLG